MSGRIRTTRLKSWSCEALSLVLPLTHRPTRGISKRKRMKENTKDWNTVGVCADLGVILHILDRLAKQKCQQEVVHLWDVDVMRHKPCQHLEAWHMPRLLTDFTKWAHHRPHRVTCVLKVGQRIHSKYLAAIQKINVTYRQPMIYEHVHFLKKHLISEIPSIKPIITGVK